MTRRRVGSVLAIMAAAFGLVSVPAFAQDDFYDPPAELPSGSDGDVIRHESMQVYGGLAGKAQRVMYLSRDTQDEPIAVTGTVLTPHAPWTGAGERPVIGYAAGTQGLGDACAPSKQLESGMEYEGPFMASLLARGYAIAITDYQGLGTPGEHPYVNRAATAHAVLDAVRAAQRLPEANLPDNGPVATAGYSQGGGASAAAAELQPEYAPELDLKGSYAGAPPANLKEVAKFLDGQLAAGLLGYAVAGLETAYPNEIDLKELLNDRGEQLVEDVKDQCVGETAARYPFTKTETLTEDGRPITAYLDEEPFSSLVDEQKLGERQPGAPVLVAHSRFDDIVPFEQGKQMARDWCDAGATVQFKTLEVPTHVGGYPAAAPAVHSFLGKVFNGKPAPSNCGEF